MKTSKKKIKSEPVPSTPGLTTTNIATTPTPTTQPVVKPRGRGRPRKYPLPDNHLQKLTEKKLSSGVPKIVTRKQSQSTVSKIISSLNRNVTDTDSDGNIYF